MKKFPAGLQKPHAAHAYDAQHRQMRDACRRRTTPTTNAKCHPHSNKPQTRTCACHHPILPQKAMRDLDATSSSGSPTGRQPEKALTTLRNRIDAARCTTDTAGGTMRDATGNAARYELGTLAGLLDRPCTRLTISCEEIVMWPLFRLCMYRKCRIRSEVESNYSPNSLRLRNPT